MTLNLFLEKHNILDFNTEIEVEDYFIISVTHEIENIVYPKSMSFSEYSRWQNECLNSLEWKNLLKEEIVGICQQHSDNILASKNDIITYRIFHHEYRNFVSDLIDDWLDLWKSLNIEITNLDFMILFYKLLFKCVDKERLEDWIFYNKSIEEDAEEFIREEIRYWSNEENCIRDSGYNNWSDPF